MKELFLNWKWARYNTELILLQVNIYFCLNFRVHFTSREGAFLWRTEFKVWYVISLNLSSLLLTAEQLVRFERKGLRKAESQIGKMKCKIKTSGMPRFQKGQLPA